MIVANCGDCEYQVETDDITEAITAFNKHDDHTGHDLEVTKFDVNLDLELEPGHEVVCSQCDESWRFSAKEDAEEYAQDHGEYTDHKPDRVEAAEILSKEAIEDVVRKLGRASPSRAGVPESLLVESCLSVGYQHNDVENAIEAARDDAKIYPVRRGFYQAV